MNAMKDIMDLCRLQQMEEHITGSPAVDAPTTFAAIDWKRRQLAQRLANTPPTLAPDAMERHRNDNTAADGTYPWTESPLHRCVVELPDEAQRRGVK
jgi:hypothetical protein